MDFLNKSYKQIVDLFLSMTPGARITAGLLLTIIVVSLVYLFQVQANGTAEYLMGGRDFTQDELTDMARAFGKAELGGYEIDELKRVRVPRGQKATYMAALADENALPKNFTDYLDKILENSGPFGVAKHVLEQQLKNDKEKKLSMMISQMKGIENANVQIDTIKRQGLRGDIESRAVVFVKAEGNDPLPTERVAAISTTMGTGVSGLSPENITVTDLNAGRAYQGTKNGGIPGVPNSPYLANKLAHEEVFRKKIQGLLKAIPGVVVGVHVELDDSLAHQETAVIVDPKPVALEVTEETTSESTSRPEKGGRPGVTSNSGTANAPAQVSQNSGTETKVEKGKSSQTSITSKTTSVTDHAGLIPTRVTTTIGIPKSYYLQLWHARNKPAEGEEPLEPDQTEVSTIEQDTIEMVRNMVVPQLPKRDPGKDPFEHVAVETIETLAPEAYVGPTTTENATAWLAGNWQSIGMALFGVFSLVMLRGMIRGGAGVQDATADPGPRLNVDSATASDEEETEEDDHGARLRFETSGPNLRAELTQLVKDDPDAAANVLKSWIGDAA